MKAPRFTVRVLLLVVTVTAIGLGFSRRFFMIRPVTVKECESVKIDMSPWQVRYLLGPPHYSGKTLNRISWAYDLEDNSLTYANFVIENSRVTSIERRIIMPFVSDFPRQ